MLVVTCSARLGYMYMWFGIAACTGRGTSVMYATCSVDDYLQHRKRG